MKKATRFIGLTLTGILMFSLAVPSFGFAQSPFGENGNGDKLKGYEKNLEKFTEIDGQMVKLNHMNINFDTPPVIKEGRTLIPVRALTEGMGATVVWNGEKHTVTITHPDSNLEIVFNLETGKVTVDGDEVTLDVKPGIHNNRTYVPLRFIAETFGLKVSHDNQSGETNIENGPVLNPTKVAFEDESDITAVDVKLVLNGYSFEGIKGLDEGTGTNDEYTYDSGDKTVTLDKDYIESLDAEKTTLKFQFKDGSTEVEKSFKIMLDFNSDEATSEPAISPEKVTFTDAEDVDDVTVDLTLNGYSFEGIQGLDEGDDFDVDGTEVTIDKDYIAGLTDEETTLNFLFEKDSTTVKEKFEIKLDYNDESNEPVISPEKAKFDSLGDVVDVDVTLDLNGYTLDKIMNGSDTLVKNTDYDVNGNVVTLDDNYLKDLNHEETELTFVFEKAGSDDVELGFEVEIKGLD